MAVDAFLKIETPTVAGESTDDKHKGEIEILSYNFGATHNTTVGSATGGAGSGKTTFQNFTFHHAVDKSSPLLFQACASGTHYAKATLTVRKAGGTQMEYLVVKMETVFVESVSVAGSGMAQEVPTEQVSLAVGQIVFDYKEQKPDGTLGGSVTGGWNVTTNKKA
jgi:type VI secretion system secreted protein Hcp